MFQEHWNVRITNLIVAAYKSLPLPAVLIDFRTDVGRCLSICMKGALPILSHLSRNQLLYKGLLFFNSSCATGFSALLFVVRMPVLLHPANI